MKTRACRFAVLVALAVSLKVNASGETVSAGVWASIYSPDVSTFADNLRKAGVPEATVGVLISQEINSVFKMREQSLEPSISSLQSLQEGWSAERREALVKLHREKNDLLRAVLGTVPDETAKTELIPESLANATTAQRQMIRLILEDYNAMNARIQKDTRGYLLDEDREKLRYLKTAADADLAKVITPEQAIDYQIETDGFMRAMRQRLELFKPTVQELRDIYTARRSTGFDIEVRNINSNRLMELQKATLAELAKRWGSERYAQYSRLASTLYQQAYQLARRLELPTEVADQIHESRKAAYKKAWDSMPPRGTRLITVTKAMGTPTSSPPPPPVSSFTAVTREAIAEHCELVKHLLGDAGYEEYYKLNSSWIDGMKDGRATNPEIFERFLLL